LETWQTELWEPQIPVQNLKMTNFCGVKPVRYWWDIRFSEKHAASIFRV
jgi:hypothetical protein